MGLKLTCRLDWSMGHLGSLWQKQTTKGMRETWSPENFTDLPKFRKLKALNLHHPQVWWYWNRRTWGRATTCPPCHGLQTVISWHKVCHICSSLTCSALTLSSDPVAHLCYPIFHASTTGLRGHCLSQSRKITPLKRKKNQNNPTLRNEIKSKKCFFKQDQFPKATESDPTSSHADISDGRKKLWGRGNTFSSLNSRPVLCLMKSQPEETALRRSPAPPLPFPPKPRAPITTTTSSLGRTF